RPKVAGVLVKIAGNAALLSILRARALAGSVVLDERSALSIAYDAMDSRDPFLRRSAIDALSKWDARQAATRKYSFIEPDERMRLLAAAADSGVKFNSSEILGLVDPAQARRVAPPVRQQILLHLVKVAMAVPAQERLSFLADMSSFGVVPANQLTNLV